VWWRSMNVLMNRMMEDGKKATRKRKQGERYETG
jgi:hypothetical protein